jgi:hypothetical protein
VKIDVQQRGLDRAAFFFRRMARNARNLYPLANKARERWHESEQRTFAANAQWAPRKPSTIKRYRWPIKTINGYRKGRSQKRGPGFYTGGLRKALTTPHQPGIRDRVDVGRGRLSLDVGIKGGRQPRTYGRWFNDGAGARPARPVISFDDQAARALAADTRGHILPRGDGR